MDNALESGFVMTAKYLGLSTWMPEEEVQKYSDRINNLKNACLIMRGCLETYLAGWTSTLPFKIDNPDYDAWVDLINSAGDGSSYESIP